MAETTASCGPSEDAEAQEDACRCETETRSTRRHTNTSTQQQPYDRLRTRTGRMPRQWLIDRCDGKSKYGESRPPNRSCWPPILLKWFPDLLEQNCCCETVGKFGCVDPTNARRRRALLWTCFTANVVGLTFLILASFAISEESFGLLSTFAFTQVWAEVLSGPEKYVETPPFFHIGLRAAAWYQTVAGGEKVVIPFTHFCDLDFVPSPSTTPRDEFATLFVDTQFSGDDGCDSCKDISKRIVPSLFLSMLGYIPNFTTDILRLYVNYDVNCQKFLASIFSWISLSTAIYTWVNYHRNCFSYLNHSPLALNEDMEPISTAGANSYNDAEEENPYMVVQFRYSAGFGEVCLALASLLKIVDIICNIILPTPSITRDHAEQVEYEWKYGPAPNADDPHPPQEAACRPTGNASCATGAGECTTAACARTNTCSATNDIGAVGCECKDEEDGFADT